jgi:hypothetical protein
VESKPSRSMRREKNEESGVVIDALRNGNQQLRAES